MIAEIVTSFVVGKAIGKRKGRKGRRSRRRHRCGCQGHQRPQQQQQMMQQMRQMQGQMAQMGQQMHQMQHMQQLGLAQNAALAQGMGGLNAQMGAMQLNQAMQGAAMAGLLS